MFCIQHRESCLLLGRICHFWQPRSCSFNTCDQYFDASIALHAIVSSTVHFMKASYFLQDLSTMCEADGHFAWAAFLQSCDFQKVSNPYIRVPFGPLGGVTPRRDDPLPTRDLDTPATCDPRPRPHTRTVRDLTPATLTTSVYAS